MRNPTEICVVKICLINVFRFYLYLDCLILDALPEMPLHYLPKIIKMVRIHKQAKELDEHHLKSLKNQVIKLIIINPFYVLTKGPIL